jgi:hypothetical protein
VRISNDPELSREVMFRAGECPEVVLEATYGEAVSRGAVALRPNGLVLRRTSWLEAVDL